tara:strand:- start:1707 stop:2093 length:387 start_codon:yes stop_codon:yes gene_type:complete
LGIDLNTSEGRKKYLSEKLDDLLDGINDSYGTFLMEELLSRLELTVKDFNEEMKTLCDDLVNKEKERQQLLEMLKNVEELPQPSKSASKTQSSKTNNDMIEENNVVIDNEVDEDAPEWEKKLAKLEKK